MTEPFVGEIRIFGFSFAPRGYAFCNGQTQSIAQNTALYTLLGTTYGGDGVTTFALPNLQSRVPIHFGQGNVLSPYALGQQAGSETVTLTTTQIPGHGHAVAPGASSGDATDSSPQGNVPASIPAGGYTNTPNTTMAATTSGLTGGSQPHSNLQPYLAVNFCIALEGIYPSRN